MDLEHEKRMTEMEQRSKANTKRIEAVEKWQADFSELIGTVRVLADREKRVEEDVVQEIKGKPAKRWEGIVDKIMYGIIGAVITYIMVNIGF